MRYRAGWCGLLAALAAVGAPTFGQTLPAEQWHTKPAVCFLPGTDPEIVKSFSDAGFGNAPQEQAGFVFNDNNRWSGGQGNPRALTWSLVADGVSIVVNLGGCNVNGASELFSRMDDLFVGQAGRATWIGRIQEMFDRWAALTGTSYTRLTSPGQDWDDGASFGTSGNGSTRGDIRIGMVPVLGGGGCGNIIAFNFFPGSGIGGDMVLNTNFNWSDSANEHRFLRNVLAHEHGHGLGISHVCPLTSSKLMEPFINLNFDGPQHDEIRAGQRGYGDPFEPDNTAAQATDLGALLSGAPVSIGITSGNPFPFPEPGVELGSILSIDANGEQDYFRFHVDGPGPVSAVVTPIGNRYDSSLQACGGNPGSCCSGSFVDSDFIADLNMQIIDTDGSTVLATAAAQPVGNSETLVAISLPTAGDYFIRVFEGNSPSQPQLYHLALSRGEAVCLLSGEPTVQMQFGATGFTEPKNRVLPIKAGDQDLNQTIRVTWDEMPNWAGGHETLEGQQKFITEPFQVCESSGDGLGTVPPDCAPSPGQPQKWFWVARLTCDSAAAWFGDLAGLTDFCSGSGEACASDGDCAQGTCGIDGVIHIVDDGIAPTKNENQQAIYTVQLAAEGCVLSDQASFSDPLVITQPPFGDLVGAAPGCPMPPPNGNASLIPDVTAGLDKFSNSLCAAKKTRVDLEPTTLDFKVGISDVLKTLGAFAGSEYDLSAGTTCTVGAAGIPEDPRRHTR